MFSLVPFIPEKAPSLPLSSPLSSPLLIHDPFQPWGSGLKGDTKSIASWYMWQGCSWTLQVRDVRMLRTINPACAGSFKGSENPAGRANSGVPRLWSRVRAGEKGGMETQADPSCKTSYPCFVIFCSSWSPVDTKEERGSSSEMS